MLCDWSGPLPPMGGERRPSDGGPTVRECSGLAVVVAGALLSLPSAFSCFILPSWAFVVSLRLDECPWYHEDGTAMVQCLTRL